MSNYFLYDAISKNQVTFDEFIKSLNERQGYFEIWQYKNFIEFIENFVFALINNKPIMLLDKDFSETELESLGLKNSSTKYCEFEQPKIIKDATSFISSLLNSTSEITVFTSGTTGIPKTVVHTVKSLTRMTRVDISNQHHIWAMCYNPTHMAGLQVLFQAILNINKIIYLFESPISNTEALLNSEKVTHISATPTFYRLLLATNIVHPFIVRTTLGGEKSEDKLYNALKIKFPNAKFNNIYASTELGSLFIGKGERFTVPENIKSFIKIGTDNELLIHKSVAGKTNVDESWFATGDIVTDINDNPLSFCFFNRKNDMINTGGYKVNPIEVEETLYKINGVLNARVFGKKNSVLGNIICAEVVLSENRNITTKEIQEYLSIKLQEFKVPRIIKIVDKIEATRTGKLSRK